MSKHLVATGFAFVYVLQYPTGKIDNKYKVIAARSIFSSDKFYTTASLSVPAVHQILCITRFSLLCKLHSVATSL